MGKPTADEEEFRIEAPGGPAFGVHVRVGAALGVRG
jgi:hypothetical protein